MTSCINKDGLSNLLKEIISEGIQIAKTIKIPQTYFKVKLIHELNNVKVLKSITGSGPFVILSESERADIRTTRALGFFHDIGKIISYNNCVFLKNVLKLTTRFCLFKSTTTSKNSGHFCVHR